MHPQSVPLMGQASGAAGRYQMAGLGFGLPMARLFARYFGGELTLVNLPHYGVDAYVTLRALDGWHWEEGAAAHATAGTV